MYVAGIVLALMKMLRTGSPAPDDLSGASPMSLNTPGRSRRGFSFRCQRYPVSRMTTAADDILRLLMCFVRELCQHIFLAA
jgi:hypothetical protein